MLTLETLLIDAFHNLKHYLLYLYNMSLQRQTGHSGIVAFAIWAACFGVILGQVAYKIEWEKAGKG